MKKTTGILLSLVTLLAGTVAGIIIAPIKKGINVGCNNGNRFHNEDYDYDEDDDEDEWLSSSSKCDKDDMPF